MTTLYSKNPKDLPGLVYKLFFTGAKIIYKGKELQATTVAGGKVKKIKIGNYIYLEQNPIKNSRWGALARCNHNILWIINDTNGKYIGRVVDGQISQL